jgi:hypothetical protein
VISFLAVALQIGIDTPPVVDVLETEDVVVYEFK